MTYEDYLSHHGIKGQKWGVRNGPPYPLSRAKSSAVKKKASPKAGASAKEVWNSLDDASKAYVITASAVLLAYAGVAVKRGADAVNANRKIKKYDKRIKSNEVDKETKFPKKNKEFTADQDMKQVNPGFKNFKQDTKMNCMYCTTAYELRRRGYDVIAEFSAEGKDYDDVTKWFPKTKVDGVNGERFESWREKHRIENKNDKGETTYSLTPDGMKIVSDAFIGKNHKLAVDTMRDLRRQGDGARGNLMVTWPTGSGHSVVYEVVGNEVILRDCQSGKVLKPDKFLNYCITAEYARYDNVDFDAKAIKECIRKR